MPTAVAHPPPPGRSRTPAAVSAAEPCDGPAVAVWQARFPRDSLGLWALAGTDVAFEGGCQPAPAGTAGSEGRGSPHHA
jgi:hypothetical protein